MKVKLLKSGNVAFDDAEHWFGKTEPILKLTAHPIDGSEPFEIGLNGFLKRVVSHVDTVRRVESMTGKTLTWVTGAFESVKKFIGFKDAPPRVLKWGDKTLKWGDETLTYGK